MDISVYYIKLTVLGHLVKKKKKQAVKEKLGVGPVQFYKKVKYMPEC